jgi:hypothetical protein
VAAKAKAKRQPKAVFGVNLTNARLPDIVFGPPAAAAPWIGRFSNEVKYIILGTLIY